MRETLLKKGSANSGGPLCPSDISPLCGESPSNSLPKTVVWFFSQWYYSQVSIIKQQNCRTLLNQIPLRKKRNKSLWKGVRGDSPRGGEMSAKQTEGTDPIRGNLSSERFAPVKSVSKSNLTNAPESYQNPNFSALALPESRDSR